MDAQSTRPLLLVSDSDLEQQLEIVRSRAASPLEGVFGPHSFTWRVNREALVFLGAGRALHLQLAHPWVAAAIAQHSGSLVNPIGRFHRTFRIVFSLVFGTLDQAFDAARRLHRRHAGVSGVLPAPVGKFSAGIPYRANDVRALCWVHATLIETALLVYDLILPPLTEDEREAYYSESKILAGLLGIPSSCLPPEWNSFAAYNETMWRSEMLSVGMEAKAIVQQLFGGTQLWSLVPSWYKALTAWLLPHEVRHAYGLTYSGVEHRCAMRAIARIRRIYQYSPKSLRYVGPYQEAMARLSGRVTPSRGTRMLNRLWIGQPELGCTPLQERKIDSYGDNH